MTQITGTLNDAQSKVLNGTNGAWTKYTLVVDGKDYQVKQDVFNHASALLGQTVHLDAVSKQKGDYTNWYGNAIFAEHERGPANAQERNPDNPAARAMNAQAASQGLVTELMRHESIARMAAVKHLIEADKKITPGFFTAAKRLSDFYLTGKLPNEETVVTEVREKLDAKPIIPQAAVDTPFDESAPQYTDDDIPFD